mmetsp:Transcript_34512/g.90398  ORF Transcript_34512/g.90398 Transcript_34512/m.90398 type:complete len:233 (-) Transcript_34512:202-900(-)
MPVRDFARLAPQICLRSPVRCRFRAKTLRRICHRTPALTTPQSSPRRAATMESQWLPSSLPPAVAFFSASSASASVSTTSSSSSSSLSSPSRSSPSTAAAAAAAWLAFLFLYLFSCVPTTTRSNSPPFSGHHSASSSSAGLAFPTFHEKTSVLMGLPILRAARMSLSPDANAAAAFPHEPLSLASCRSTPRTCFIIASRFSLVAGRQGETLNVRRTPLSCAIVRWVSLPYRT